MHKPVLHNLNITDEYLKAVERWKYNPEEALQGLWGPLHIWSKPQEILRSVVKHKRTAVRSGHGVGKSFFAAKIVLWFLYEFHPAKVITTAPTWYQVEKILWTEIRKSHSTANFPLGGRCLDTEIKIEPDWFAIGLSTKEGVEGREFGATKMQGFHSPNLLVVLDEAAGIPPEIWKAIESLITGANNKVLAIGNPASPIGDFYKCFKSPIWNRIHISCFDHPNVITGQEIIPGCVTREWIEERKLEWGEGSPLYKAKVLGDFPDEGTDTLIPMSWATAAAARRLEKKGTRRLGGDIARFGDDSTEFFEIWGGVATEIDRTQKQDTMQTSGKLIRFIDDAKSSKKPYDHIGIDDSSMGGGVTDRLVEQGYEIDPINFGSAAIDPEHFLNTRAEAYWLLRERIKPDSTDPLQIPNDDNLINELSSIKFFYTSKGQIKIEEKAEIKKRLGRSPDRSDALAIANYAGRRNKEPTIRFL